MPVILAGVALVAIAHARAEAQAARVAAADGDP
jgi:isopentenyl diphosphate isomerase/L-lactate dehydrogenase-like FMN-dependent dehydrogenase